MHLCLLLLSLIHCLSLVVLVLRWVRLSLWLLMLRVLWWLIRYRSRLLLHHGRFTLFIPLWLYIKWMLLHVWWLLTIHTTELLSNLCITLFTFVHLIISNLSWIWSLCRWSGDRAFFPFLFWWRCNRWLYNSC